ncbi:DUF6708 domain-containing protein [Herbaspirillum robiniae]|uniref:DUF6708 domain-containing protein n=1 Tax=Herbaspirillum robiniae TaxID=2014887 RepID=UPI0013FD0FB2|nr:DUF6708 domain-containing protein [Herbaspirillum robiniae]
MGSSGSRFNAPTPYWFEDLPVRTARLEENPDADLVQDVIEVGESHLDISRTSTVLRGGLLFLGLLVLLMLCWFAPHTLNIFLTPPRSAVVIGILTVLNVSLVGYSLFVIWLDCHIPRDLPVRFDRGAGKLHVYDYSLSLNPFARRRVEVKQFDWSDVEAELTKQAGYNGKAYMIRYALVLVICKPGSNEVLDRVTLKGNDITIKGLQAMWSYVRRYMAEGPANLPPVQALAHGISLRRSLFTYMPYFDPSEEGSRYRSRMQAIDVVLVFFMMWFFWLWLPMGLCHYIAMRLAPEPRWPDAMAERATVSPSAAK